MTPRQRLLRLEGRNQPVRDNAPWVAGVCRSTSEAGSRPGGDHLTEHALPLELWPSEECESCSWLAVATSSQSLLQGTDVVNSATFAKQADFISAATIAGRRARSVACIRDFCSFNRHQRCESSFHQSERLGSWAGRLHTVARLSTTKGLQCSEEQSLQS